MRLRYLFLVLVFFCLTTVLPTNGWSQKRKENKCDFVLDKVDDFTKKRTVITDEEIIADVIKKAFALTVQEAIDNTVRIYIHVCAINIQGTNGLKFIWGANNSEYVGDFDQLDFILANGEIVSLKDEEPSESKSGEYWYFSIKSFMISEDATWAKFKANPISKLRISSNGRELKQLDIDKKYIYSIQKVVNCMDALNIPKSYDVNSNVQSNKIAASSPVQPISQSAQIKPLGNNSEISILKQWKRITELGKDGIPLNFNDVLVIQYLADGTYKTKQVTKEGEFIEGTGRYQLLKDNSIIVYLMDNGKTYSAVIKKLTNSELEIKSDDYHTFFMVY